MEWPAQRVWTSRMWLALGAHEVRSRMTHMTRIVKDMHHILRLDGPAEQDEDGEEFVHQCWNQQWPASDPSNRMYTPRLRANRPRHSHTVGDGHGKVHGEKGWVCIYLPSDAERLFPTIKDRHRVHGCIKRARAYAGRVNTCTMRTKPL